MSKTQGCSLKSSALLIPTTSTLETSQQIQLLGRLTQCQEENQLLRQEIDRAQELIFKRTTKQSSGTQLPGILAQLTRQNTKLEVQVAKTIQRQNVALAEIKVRKQNVKLARNQRVIHSGIFKNIEKEVRLKQNLYKNLLVNKKVEQLTGVKAVEEFNRVLDIYRHRITQTEHLRLETQTQKQVERTFREESQPCIMQAQKADLSQSSQEPRCSTHRQKDQSSELLSKLGLYQIQSQRILAMTGQDTLQSASELIELDNVQLVQNIQRLTDEIQHTETALKHINSQAEPPTEVTQFAQLQQRPDYAAKQHLISKINKQKSLIEDMRRKAGDLARMHKIPLEDKTDRDLLSALEGKIIQRFGTKYTTRGQSAETDRLTQLLSNSKRTRENQQPMSQCRLREVFRGLNEPCEWGSD